MKTQKEHKKATLMKWTKAELVDYIMCLEHNINVLNETFENQYNNCYKLFNDMQIVNNAYSDAKEIIKRSLKKSEGNAVKILTPCDACAYGVPSSGDGKPCIVCPARATMD